MGTRALDLPPRAGWNWLLKGWQLFRKNPAGVMVLTAAYLGISLFLAVLLPFVGSVLVALLNPGLSAGLMTGCRMIDRGLPVTPSVIISPFLEENRRLAKPFLRLGVLYAICVMGVSIIASLFVQADFSGLTQEGGASPELLSELLNLVTIMAVLYTPVLMLFWYAPSLVLWHDIEPRKALFFSLVTVWRNRGAFLIYSMGWLLWTFGIASVLIVFLSLLPLPAAITGALNFVIAMAAFGVTACTFYPSYIDVFEATPDDPATRDPDSIQG